MSVYVYIYIIIDEYAPKLWSSALACNDLLLQFQGTQISLNTVHSHFWLNMCPPGALFKQWSIRKAASVVQRHNANYPQDNKPGFGASLELSIDDEHLMK